MWREIPQYAGHGGQCREYELPERVHFDGTVLVRPHARPMVISLTQNGNPLGRWIDGPRSGRSPDGGRGGLACGGLDGGREGLACGGLDGGQDRLRMFLADGQPGDAMIGWGRRVVTVAIDRRDEVLFEDEAPLLFPDCCFPDGHWDSGGRPRIPERGADALRIVEGRQLTQWPGSLLEFRLQDAGYQDAIGSLADLLLPPLRVARILGHQADLPAGDSARRLAGGLVFIPGPHFARAQLLKSERVRARRGVPRSGWREHELFSPASAGWPCPARLLTRKDPQDKRWSPVRSWCPANPRGWRPAVVRDRRGNCVAASAFNSGSGLVAAQCD